MLFFGAFPGFFGDHGSLFSRLLLFGSVFRGKLSAFFRSGLFRGLFGLGGKASLVADEIVGDLYLNNVEAQGEETIAST